VKVFEVCTTSDGPPFVPRGPLAVEIGPLAVEIGPLSVEIGPLAVDVGPLEFVACVEGCGVGPDEPHAATLSAQAAASSIPPMRQVPLTMLKPLTLLIPR